MYLGRVFPVFRRASVTLRKRIEASEFKYQLQGWSRPLRFVVIRRPRAEGPSAQLVRTDSRLPLLLPASGPREDARCCALRKIQWLRT